MNRRGIDIEGRAVAAVETGPRPDLVWLALDKMVIDERFQRPLAKGNWKSIDTIAANFRWSRFGPVLVAPVEGGMYSVIDGQHRAHAAAICGLAEVPAMIVDVGLEEQSRAFAWINSQAIRVSVFHVLKAAIAAREDWALRADSAVSAAGCRLMTYNMTGANKQAGQVFCVGFVRRQIEAGNDAALRAGLTALRGARGLGDRPVAYTDFLIRPWIMAVAESCCTNVARLTSVLESENPFKVIERAGPVMGRATLRKMIDRAVVLA